VTIRYLADELRGDATFLDRYRAEARIVATLRSPNIAELYEYVESDGGVATVREYVDGGSVRQVLATSAIQPQPALSVLKGGLTALASAHACGARHGGYKPENLLIDRQGTTKLADFGLRPADAAGDEVAAAVTTFLECLAGSRSTRRRGRALRRLPKRIRAVVSNAAEQDSATAAGDIDAAARASYGAEWEAEAKARLAQQVSRVKRPA
jgi:serine/threonine-protein kinase